MYTRSDDDILPAGRRRGAVRARRAAKAPEPTRARRRRRLSGRPAVGVARPPKARTALVEVLLTLGALLGVAVTGVTVLAAQTGLRPLVVRSGSMEPTIATGSMVLVRQVSAAEIRTGDIVAVERPDHTRVTHRVLSIDRHGDVAELTLKGDANEDPDPVPVSARQAERLVYQLPQIGRMASELATPRGGFLVGCAMTAGLTQVVRRRTGVRLAGCEA